MATAVVERPGTSQLFIATRSGLVYRLDHRDLDGLEVPALIPRPVLDLRDHTSTAGERGLLGLAFDRDGRTLVVVHTALDGAVTVRSFRMEDGVPDERTGRVIGSIPHPFAGHNGGDVVTLPSGDMVVSLGDMDTQDDPPLAQDPESLLGRLVVLPQTLLSDEGERDWPSPADVVAMGLRNPWRVSVDDATGEVWVGDVGADAFEEIDLLPTVDVAGSPVNFGWPWFEGTLQRSDVPDPQPELAAPTVEYPHGDDRCGIVLGPLLRNPDHPDRAGLLLFGDLCSTDLMAVGTSGPNRRPAVVGQLAASPLAFALDSRGSAYVVDAAGDIYRLDPLGWRPPDVRSTVRPPAGPETAAALPEICGVLGAFEALASMAEMQPDQFRETVDAARSELEEIDPELGPEDRSDVRQLSAVLDALAQVGAANDWDASSPQIEELTSAITAGQAPYDEFGTSLARLQDRSGASCAPG